MLKPLKKFIVKILLYAVLLIFVLATWLWMLDGHSSLSENFFAGAVEILVTVILIDGLLAIDRKRRMKAINKAEASEVKTITSLRLMGLTNAFGFEYGTSIKEARNTNLQMRTYINNFFDDQRFKDFIKKLTDMDEALLPILVELDKLIEKELSETRKSLEKVKPYPDPEIIRWIDDLQPKIIAQLTVVNFMYEMIYKDLPKTLKSDPKKDKNFWPFFKNRMYEDLVISGEGKSDKESVESIIKGLFNLLLDIHEKAEGNKLYYDI